MNQNTPYTSRLNEAARVDAVAAMSSSRPRHWMVAGISPTSLIWITNCMAARATA
jgi:hypothetical protein